MHVRLHGEWTLHLMSLLGSFGLMMLKFFSFVASLGFSNNQLTKSTLVYRDYALGVLLGSVYIYIYIYIYIYNLNVILGS